MTSRTPLMLSAMLGVLLLSASTADGATINYTFTIDGGTDFANVTPGEHTLGIWGEVTDNVLEGSNNGGILQFSVNISSPGIMYAGNVTGFPAVDDGTWKSVFSSAFSTIFLGHRDSGGYSIYALTGSIGPANFGSHPFTVGSNGPSLLTYGNFTWDGLPVRIEVVPFDLTGQLIFTERADGSYGAGYPDNATGMSAWLGVPEPAAGSLALALLIGNATWLRRRA